MLITHDHSLFELVRTGCGWLPMVTSDRSGRHADYARFVLDCTKAADAAAFAGASRRLRRADSDGIVSDQRWRLKWLQAL